MIEAAEREVAVQERRGLLADGRGEFEFRQQARRTAEGVREASARIDALGDEAVEAGVPQVAIPFRLAERAVGAHGSESEQAC
ncbi:hypothetical protein [Planctomyces sp. SH-PL62]|uniref:hypothetical protein n=1 Tax=Planctomyces sp. SH-PL62 TaxID=1636152 RepID=UPI000839166E|nr:hypothetical protein [Planctomyces sp. SH-PL62]